jgi:hypothetical protein
LLCSHLFEYHSLHTSLNTLTTSTTQFKAQE